MAGALLVTAGPMLGICTVVGVETYGWTSAHTLGLGALALALPAGFVLRQATARAPPMPLRVLRPRKVSGADVQMLMVAALFPFRVFMAQRLQKGLGCGAAATALAMLPAALVIGAVSLGLAVLSTLAAARTEALTAAGPPSAEALTGGHRLACTVGAALLVAAFAVASVVVRRKSASTLNPTEARTG
ncbi:hypothetical protein [Streptomyces sp. NPDC057107]|uniref:hypothetical protein n=1 Tax=Streptomyces sp. NPDC057107 TaxID=3346021 RepID=UPI0036301A93